MCQLTAVDITVSIKAVFRIPVMLTQDRAGFEDFQLVFRL